MQHLEPASEMNWPGDAPPSGWEVIERNPAPYYLGLKIRRIKETGI